MWSPRRLTPWLLIALGLAAAPVQAGPLHDAAREGDVAKIEDLIAQGTAALDARGEDGQTPLIEAALAGHEAAAEARIEGDLREGARVLLVEDLNTDGRSKVAFAEGLREAGAEVRHVFVVFDYGIFPHGRRTLAEAGLTLHALTTWRDALANIGAC